MVSVTEAQQIIKSHIPRPSKEVVELSKASERILASDILAPFPMPRFHNSAMDGFAVHSKDTEGALPSHPVELKLAGVIPAGETKSVSLPQGHCVQIMTGAPMPKGADAVVKVEDTSGFSDSGTVQIFHSAKSGENVRLRSEEIQEGTSLITVGTKITAAELGVLASFGFGQVPVFRRVKVAVFVTGDELQQPGVELKAGQIYNSNLPVLVDLVEKSGAKVVIQTWIRDDQTVLETSLRQALETADLILTTGGVSMGRFDYLRPVLERLGVREHFWKVAQKPGKPLYFGSRDSKLIFSLPGNPVSAFVGFMVWVWPVLAKWQGAPPLKVTTGRLKTPFKREKDKYRFLFGTARMEEGDLMCEPATKTGSHMLTAALDANCILEAEPGESPLTVGSEIRLQLLPWRSLV
jgi:molybdopterin molybdotransferase